MTASSVTSTSSAMNIVTCPYPVEISWAYTTVLSR